MKIILFPIGLITVLAICACVVLLTALVSWLPRFLTPESWMPPLADSRE